MTDHATHNAYRLLTSNPELTAEAGRVAHSGSAEDFKEWGANELDAMTALQDPKIAQLAPAAEVDWTEVHSRMTTRH